jgi:hypothetical protein
MFLTYPKHKNLMVLDQNYLDAMLSIHIFQPIN